MKIGELAAATDTAVETIRFYEREGLISEPARTDSNYRQYGPAHVQRLAFIRRCRSLDMSLDEVRVLLRFLDQPAADCGEVNAVLDEHIEHVARRVRELKVLEKQLRELRATEYERALAVWRRKFGSAGPTSEASARLRQMRFLAGRGFSPEVIRRVLRQSGLGDDLADGPDPSG